jgi:hypothetical protein
VPKVGGSRVLLLTVGMALAACGGERREGMICLPLAAARALAGIEAEAAAASTPSQFRAEPPFIEVWSAVAGGQANAGSAGEWRMDRMRDGSVLTWRASAPPPIPRTGSPGGPGGAGGTVGAGGAGGADTTSEDEELRHAVLSRIAEHPLLKDLRPDLRATAQGGVVYLEGTVTNAVLGAEAVRLALATPGVRAVVSRLHWSASGAPSPP